MIVMKKILTVIFGEWETKGVSMPLMYDPVADKASLTVLFPYVSFWLTFFSLIAMHFYPSIWSATFGCGLLWLLSTVLYMIRKLNTAKIDFDDKSIELEAEETECKVQEDPSTTGRGAVPDSPQQP